VTEGKVKNTPYQIPSTQAEVQKSPCNEKIPPPIPNQGNTREVTPSKQSEKNYIAPVKSSAPKNEPKEVAVQDKSNSMEIQQNESEKLLNTDQTNRLPNSIISEQEKDKLDTEVDTKDKTVTDIAISGNQAKSDVTNVDTDDKEHQSQSQGTATQTGDNSNPNVDSQQNEKLDNLKDQTTVAQGPVDGQKVSTLDANLSDIEQNKSTNESTTVGKNTTGIFVLEVNGQKKFFNCSIGQLEVCSANNNETCHYQPGNSEDLVLFRKGMKNAAKRHEWRAAKMEKAAKKSHTKFGPKQIDQFRQIAANYIQSAKSARLQAQNCQVKQ
jgi:hypothetical protein